MPAWVSDSVSRIRLHRANCASRSAWRRRHPRVLPHLEGLRPRPVADRQADLVGAGRRQGAGDRPLGGDVARHLLRPGVAEVPHEAVEPRLRGDVALVLRRALGRHRRHLGAGRRAGPRAGGPAAALLGPRREGADLGAPGVEDGEGHGRRPACRGGRSRRWPRPAGSRRRRGTSARARPRASGPRRRSARSRAPSCSSCASCPARGTGRRTSSARAGRSGGAGRAGRGRPPGPSPRAAGSGRPGSRTSGRGSPRPGRSCLTARS